MKVTSVKEGLKYAEENSYPIVVQPYFSLVAVALGTARDKKELTDLLGRALKLSPIKEVFLKSLWK